jgi:hypothetical protein
VPSGDRPAGLCKPGTLGSHQSHGPDSSAALRCRACRSPPS